MADLQPALAMVLDLQGDFGAWFGSKELEAVGDPRLPLPVTSLGFKLSEAMPWRRNVPTTEDGSVPWKQLQESILDQLNAIKDADRFRDLANDGLQVHDETLILVIGRTSDALVCRHLVDVLKFLRRLVGRFFAGHSFHFATILMLPTLFSSPTEEDFARTYRLLRRLEGYQEEPPPFQIGERHVRLLNSIWLANSSNERGQIVGRFPEAAHALTTFVQALLSGAVTYDQPPVGKLFQNKRPNYSSFGCATLCLDRAYLNDYLFCRLMQLVLPEVFLENPRPSREMVALEVQKFLRQSPLPGLDALLRLDEHETPLWPGFPFSMDEKKGLRQDALVQELTEQHDAFLRDVLPDLQIRLQERRETLEAQMHELVAKAAGEIGDRLGAGTTSEFLYVLVEDPPEETKLAMQADDATMFGLLGRAVDSLDDLIGYQEPREKLQRVSDRIKKLHSELVETQRSADELHEQIRSFEARRATLKNLKGPEGEAMEEKYQKQKEELAACVESIEIIGQHIQNARAELRGLVIARRRFQMDERLAAVGHRRQTLEGGVKVARDEYLAAVQRHREQQANLAKVYTRRRGWVYRRLFLYPSLALASVFVANLLALLVPGLTLAALTAWYAVNAVVVGDVALVGVVIYAVLMLGQGFVGLRKAILQGEYRLAESVEEVPRRAWEIVRRQEEFLRFDLDLNRRIAEVSTLDNVRVRGRQVLAQTREFLGQVAGWAAESLPVPPPSNLYRASALEPEHLERIFQDLVPDPLTLAMIFRGEMGNPSQWIYLPSSDAKKKLRQFAKTMFQTLESLTLEEIMFHPKFGMTKPTDRLLALYQAAAPYLLLKPDLTDQVQATQNTLLAFGGANSRCAEALKGCELTLRTLDHGRGGELVVVRTRMGFPAYFLEEIDTYWRDHLRSPETSTVNDSFETNFPELIPHIFLRGYERAAEAFLLLWCGGVISQQPDGYRFPQWKESLGPVRGDIYARLVDDPALEGLKEALVRQAEEARAKLVQTPAQIDNFLREQSLDRFERDVLGKLPRSRAMSL